MSKFKGNTILLWSGGLDSTTLLYYLMKREKLRVFPVYFDYGQKTNRQELKAMLDITSKLKYEHYNYSNFELIKIFYIRDLMSQLLPYSKSSLLDIERTSTEIKTSKDIDTNANIDNFVPFRNMLFLTMASIYGNSIGINNLNVGSIESQYPDDQGMFFKSLNHSIKKSCVNNHGEHYTKGIPLINHPFIKLNKKEIFNLAHELNVPINLTWSCYNNGDQPCGKCIPCVKIKEVSILE